MSDLDGRATGEVASVPKHPEDRQQWPQRLLKYVKYDLQRTRWLYFTRWRRFSALFGRHVDLIRRGTVVFSATAIGLLVNYFGEGRLSPEILSGFLVAAGTMLGATIAIVFAISTVLLQNASDIQGIGVSTALSIQEPRDGVH